MNRPILLLTVCVVLAGATFSVADEDVVAKKLMVAKEDFEKAATKARLALLADLKKKEEAAQKAGDLKGLEMVRAETKAFEKSGKLPKLVTVKAYEAQMRTARERLEEAYRSTVKQYTKDGKIELAKAAQQQLDEFQSAGGGITPVTAWVSLFNGKDLSGWSVDGGSAAQWKVENGVIVATSSSYKTRNYILSEKEFSDFVLRFEFQLDDADNTHGGIALRAIAGEKCPWDDKSQIFEHPLIKLSNPKRDPKDTSGAAHWLSVAAPFTAPVKPPKTVAGQWQKCEVFVKGNTCTAKFDGLPCVDLKLDPKAPTPFGFVPGLKRGKGKVGFQINTGTIRYRNIEMVDQSNGL